MIVGISVSRSSNTNSLHVTGDAAELRREVGPAAWFVLEYLALNATPTPGDGGWAVVTNVRAIAATLGIGKDRAATALHVLRDAGLVTVEQSKRAAGARFEPSRYRIHIPAATRDVAATSITEPRSSRRTRDLVPNPTLFSAHE